MNGVDRAQLEVRARLALARCAPADVQRLRDSVARVRAKGLQLTAVSELPARVAAITRHDDDGVQLFVLSRVLDLHHDVTALDCLLALGRWAEADLPKLTLSGPQAAALMLSDLSDEQLDRLTPPWRGFRIELDDPLVADGYSMGRLQVHLAQSELYSTLHGMWCLYSYGKHLAMPRGRPRDLHGGLLPWDPDAEYAQGGNLRPPTPAEGRAMVLLQRLALNVCIAVEGADGECAATLVEDERAKRKRQPGAPRRYRLDFEATTDLRDHIADYLSGEVERVYRIRWIVRGHWRNQPYGPGSQLRKRIWIAPFWKGPESAPIKPDAR